MTWNRARVALAYAWGWCILALAAVAAAGDGILVEAESFEHHGGWSLDTQFIQNMGSPYLLAHGLGRPVEDAMTTVRLPEPGSYNVFVRTKDWVARWKAPGQPGRFQLLVNGQPLGETLDTSGSEWSWQPGGVRWRRSLFGENCDRI
jgi:hypothetical protein